MPYTEPLVAAPIAGGLTFFDGTIALDRRKASRLAGVAEQPAAVRACPAPRGFGGGMRVGRAFLIAAAVGLLSGCAYKPLKAPCAPDEGGTPLAYAEPARAAVTEPFRTLDRCGPMKPI